jgi:signal transduction histidine kinase
MEPGTLRITLVFILTLVFPSLLLSGFAYQAVEAERRARLAERSSRAQAEARQFVAELDAVLSSPTAMLRAELESLNDPREAAPVVARLSLLEPLLRGFFLLDGGGKRIYPAAPARKPENPWPGPAEGIGGGVVGAARPPDPEHLLRLASEASSVESKHTFLDEASRRGPPRGRATALYELWQLHESLAGPADMVVALESRNALAALPLDLIDLRGRLAPALARLRLARDDLAEDEPSSRRARDLLDELQAAANSLPAEQLAQLCERTGALLEAVDPNALRRARAIAVERQQLESQCARLEETCGRVLQAVLRGRALPRMTGGDLEGSGEAAVPFVKMRFGASYEILTYGLLRNADGHPTGLVAVQIDQTETELAFEALAERAGAFLITRAEAEGTAPAEGVFREALKAPFDHLVAEIHASSVGAPAAGAFGLPAETVQLWTIFLSLVGICAGIVVTIRTVRREAKAAQLKSDFVSNVTHELKTPLTSIQMFLDTLLLGRVNSEEEVRECLEVMSRESQRLTRLIEQLLVFSRIENKKWRVRFTFASAPTLVEEAIRIVADNLHKTPEELEIDVVSIQETPKIPVDRFAIKEALLNLLHNAVKYSPDDDRKVRVVITSRRAVVEIAVEDNGMGVPRRDRRRIFVKFERGSNAEKGRIEGSGIGLTLANEIVKAHGGSIRYTALKPLGSRFSVLLPK